MAIRDMLRGLLILGVLLGPACVTDEYWVDELTVVLEGPLDMGTLEYTEALDGNVAWPGCIPGNEVHEEFFGTGGYEVEIVTESEASRESVLIRAWEDVNGDEQPNCDELGVLIAPDLEELDELIVPGEDYSLTFGGAVDGSC